MTDERRAAGGRKGGKRTSAKRKLVRERVRDVPPRDTHLYEYSPVSVQYGGGDEEDEARLRHYAAKNSRTIRSPGMGAEEALSGYFNAGNAEREHEWVSIDEGEMLAYLEANVGGFRVGLGWPGTYRWSERAIVRRHVKGIPPEHYPEEE